MGGNRALIGGVVAAVCATGAVAAATSIGGAVVDESADRAAVRPRSISVVAVGDWLPERLVTNAAAAAAAGTPARFDHVLLTLGEGWRERSVIDATFTATRPIGWVTLPCSGSNAASRRRLWAEDRSDLSEAPRPSTKPRRFEVS